MKVLFIGDIHGLAEWEKIAKQGLLQFYKIVFLGDYVDSFFVKPGEQLHNLKNICEFARKYPDDVTLLLGNHDYAYIHGITQITGYQHINANEYRKIFDDNIDLFNIAWGYTNSTTKKYTLATHAGLTESYYKHYLQAEMKEDELLHETLNRFKDNVDIMWKVGRVRGGRTVPGILWADYTEILDDPYSGINQIFGHTPRPTVTVDQIGEDIIACIDNWGNKKVVSLIFNL